MLTEAGPEDQVGLEVVGSGVKQRVNYYIIEVDL